MFAQRFQPNPPEDSQYPPMGRRRVRGGSWRRLIRVIGIAAAAAVPAACTVGPDFEHPAAPKTEGYVGPGESVDIPDAGPGSPKQNVAAEQKIAGDWWVLFHSQALDDVVKTAVANNLDLTSARATLKQAHEAVLAAEGDLYPHVDLNGDVSRQRVNPVEIGINAPPTTFNLYSIGPVVSYAVDPFGGIRREVERQQALAEQQGYQLGAAYLSITGNAVTLAIEIASVNAQIKVVRDILAVDQQTVDLVKSSREAGSSSDADVLTAESQLETDQTLMPPLEQRLSIAKHALSILIGRAPHDWAPPDFDLKSLSLPGELPVTVPSELVHQRPDILAAEARLHAASADIGVATAQLYPDISISAMFSQLATNPGHLFNAASIVWSAAAAVTAPIFRGGTLEANRRGTEDVYQATLADYEQTTLKSFGQVADTLQALVHDAEQLRAQRRALDTASGLLSRQRIRYTAGEDTILLMLDAQRQQHRANLGVVRAEAQRYLDTTQLFVAMGGGWWQSNVATEAADTLGTATSIAKDTGGRTP
jgi:NodT family efflux transporter outer membrane factor (OMF) lipoprotein